MEIIPAIDLMKGKVVRLLRGDPATQKAYNQLGDPVTVAQRWESEGAGYLHIVDLDAALGLGSNTYVIRAIVDAVGVPVQVGGGIRSLDIAEDYLKMGVNRIILGSLAFKDPSQVKAILNTHGSGRVVVALDNIQGKVVVRGWRASTRFTVEESVSMFSSLGVKIFLVTSVAKDGTLMGPDLDVLSRVCHFQGVHIIAAGGISNLEDLLVLKRLGVWGVVVGKALYEGLFSLGEALRTVRGE
ncbi:MAG: 1-(5-phosphoribosyl)-5-[(5-phosphoribosylamino)methylideneamino]imidazole-4-carboxamide isomerase [Candidatus Bathyarchaeia archaeon]